MARAAYAAVKSFKQAAVWARLPHHQRFPSDYHQANTVQLLDLIDVSIAEHKPHQIIWNLDCLPIR